MSEKGIVLLLEDSVNILNANRRILEYEGVMVFTAETIEEARRRLKIATPDVAVLDIMLPDGSGLDFLAELRQVCDAPVLFLTAKTERSDVLNGLRAGGNDYITKPYDIDEFCMRVMSFLSLARSRRGRNAAYLTDDFHLNKQELEIAIFVANGKPNKEIADIVFLSESRVKACISTVYRKLGISDSANKRDLLARMLR